MQVSFKLSVGFHLGNHLFCSWVFSGPVRASAEIRTPINSVQTHSVVTMLTELSRLHTVVSKPDIWPRSRRSSAT